MSEDRRLTKEQVENRRRWVEALRSGEYKQTTGWLKREFPEEDGGARYCCLGVVCDILPLGHWELDAQEVNRYWIGGRWDDYSSTVMPVLVMEALGFGSRAGELEISYLYDELREVSLTKLNDDGLTFEQIADVIDDDTRRRGVLE